MCNPSTPTVMSEVEVSELPEACGTGNLPWRGTQVTLFQTKQKGNIGTHGYLLTSAIRLWHTYDHTHM